MHAVGMTRDSKSLVSFFFFFFLLVAERLESFLEGNARRAGTKI